jgi:hypothetical protein
MKNFWSNLSPTKKMLFVGLILFTLGIAAYFLFWRNKDGSKEDKTQASGTPPPADFVNSQSGTNIVHNPNINPQTVPAPRTPVKSTDPQMNELIKNEAMSFAGDTLRSGDLLVEKSIPLNAFNGVADPVKNAITTILTNSLGIDATQPRLWVGFFFSTDYHTQGKVFKQDIQAAAASLKAGNFNIRIQAWNIAPLSADGTNPLGTKSFDKEAKVYKMQGLRGAEAAKFFENLLLEIDRYNREIKNVVIQKLRTSNPPYRFSDYGDN